MKHKSAAVVICVRPQDGFYLAVRRGPQDWGLPGGKTDEGESVLMTATRELSEETGLFMGVYDLIGVFYDEEVPVSVYQAIHWEGDVKDSEEGPVDWIPRSMLLTKHCTFREINVGIFRKFDAHLDQKTSLGKFSYEPKKVVTSYFGCTPLKQARLARELNVHRKEENELSYLDSARIWASRVCAEGLVEELKYLMDLYEEK